MNKEPSKHNKTNSKRKHVATNSTGALKPLTRKQKRFADILLAEPKRSANSVVKEVYNVTSDNASRNIASENLSKPNIVAYLNEHAEVARNTVLEVTEVARQYAKEGGKDGASYASVALTGAKDILDRVHGKATQRVEQRSEAVTISINLSE